MKQLDELKLLLSLIEKYELPLSPILEYAIEEKIQNLGEDIDSGPDEIDESKEAHVIGNLSARLKHVLKKCNINSLDALSEVDPRYLLKQPGCGKTTFCEAYSLLKNNGFDLNEAWQEVYLEKTDKKVMKKIETRPEKNSQGKTLQWRLEKWKASRDYLLKQGLPPNHGKPWLEEDIIQLLDCYMDGSSLEQMKKLVGRTEVSIFTKLRQLGFELPLSDGDGLYYLPDERVFQNNPQCIATRNMYWKS